MSNVPQKRGRSIRRILWIILGACLFCIGGLFTYEMLPRYIVFSFPLPSHDYNVSGWRFPSYATWRNHPERYFVWRADSTLVYEGKPDKSSRQAILNYFDEQFLGEGWTRSRDIYAPCRIIMPEAKFLKYMEDISENGYVEYTRTGFEPCSYCPANESVCLAVWTTSPGVFSISVLSAKPSPLTIFLDGIDW